ncbi:MAG: acyltransferase family protein [Bacteroidales bacterium]|nr:acyltransferase family protein [Bacteroidales bacterium]
MTSMSGRNVSVDIAKMVAAIFVIGVHTRAFSDISDWASFVFCDIICRTAVPFFAVCTGFFLTKKLLKDHITSWIPVKSAAIKTLLLYINWSVFYLLLLVFIWYKAGILTTSSFINWFKSFLIGESYFHLWYLSQTFWALLLFFPIIKLLNIKMQIVLAILLWAFGVYADIYYDLIGAGSSIINLYNRFGAVTCSIGRLLPLFLAGSILARVPSLPLRNSWLMTALSFAILIMEVYIIRSVGGTHFKYEFFSLPLAFFLFNSIRQTPINCSFDSKYLAQAFICICTSSCHIIYSSKHRSSFVFYAVCLRGIDYDVCCVSNSVRQSSQAKKNLRLKCLFLL